MSVYFSIEAEQALIDIYHYIAIENHAPKNAAAFLANLRIETVDLLSHSPKAGRVYRDNIRFIVWRNYTVTYIIHDNDDVIIADIFSPGQNWR